MSETMCTYTGRDDVLIAYLYDEIEPAERKAFTAHMNECRHCARELAALRGVRSKLSAWAPPELARALTSDEPLAASRGPRATGRSWHDIPGWVQVAAALLVLGVSAGIANVEVQRDSSGWTIRTGWSRASQAQAPTARSSSGPVPAAASAPWRADLAALEQQLRTEFRAQPAVRAVPASSTMSDTELQRRVRAIIEESERRQERELALRVGEVVKDFNNQRQADLVRINNSLGFIQSSTYGEQMKQRELVNYLLKVSQKQ
jgi:anti-sigma factor RsiW